MISAATVFVVVALIVFEVLQLYLLYDRKRIQLDENAQRVIEKIAFVHEKQEDYKRFQKIIDRDFSEQYKKILESEFAEIISTEQKVSIRDTNIYVNGRIEPYLIVRGSAKDSLSGIQTEQTTLIKDVRQLRDLFISIDEGNENQKQGKFEVKLNQKLLQQIFKKAKFVNELMLQAFKDNVYSSHEKRIDLLLLDSIIGMELRNADLPQKYSFLIVDAQGKPLAFQNTTRSYQMTMNLDLASKTRLYPNDLINEDLSLCLIFPKERAYILKEMEAYIILTILLFIMLIYAFALMYKTILEQRKIAEMKTDFISNMTHEFKTPISTISLACEAMTDKDMVSAPLGGQIEPYVRMISEENKKLEALVEGILQSATLNKNQIELKKEGVDLVRLLDQLTETMSLRLPSDGRIEKSVKGEPRHIIADAFHTTNLFTNLIDNAIKYRSEKLLVQIEIIFHNKSTVVCVKDNGIGIHKDEYRKIFEKLYRIPTGNIHNVKGFGLGLNYVKVICDEHGWDIKVSNHGGKGSIFTLTIK